MKYLKRKIIWIVVVIALMLSGCDPLQDLGSSLGDIFKGIQLPVP